MAIVVNVPKDTRLGDLGSVGGNLLGTILEKRQQDNDAKIIAEVRAGGSESEALAKVSPRNRSSVLNAGAAYRADNPANTFFKIGDSGKVVDTKTSRQAPEGFVRQEQAQFNKASKSSDKTTEISEILSTQINNSPTFAKSSDAEKKRAARNISNESQDITRFNRNLYDKLGDLTGDNRIRVDRRAVYYSDYLRGENGKPLTLDKNRAFALAKKDAEKDLQAFLKAKNTNELLTPTDFFDGISDAGSEDAKVDTGEFVPAGNKVSDDPFFGIKTLLNRFSDSNANADTVDLQNLDTTQQQDNKSSDVVIKPPEVRIQEATTAAVTVNYPVQDGEQWVEVSDGLPLVPQSMMDVVKAGNVSLIAPLYAEMAGVPVHVAIQLLKANAMKAPIESPVETAVIPDTILPQQ